MKAMQPAAARHQKPNIGARRLISSAASPDFDPRDQAELLGARGAILVRDALPRREIEDLEREAIRGFAALADNRQRCPQEFELYRKSRNVHPYQIDYHFKTSLMRILAAIRHSPTLPILQRFFGAQDLVAGLGNMLARQVNRERGAGLVGWHQDATAVESARLVTCWVPLTACGETSPALQVALRRPAKIYSYEDLRTLSVRDSESDVWKPRFDPGDMMIFRNSPGLIGPSVCM